MPSVFSDLWLSGGGGGRAGGIMPGVPPAPQGRSPAGRRQHQHRCQDSAWVQGPAEALTCPEIAAEGLEGQLHNLEILCIYPFRSSGFMSSLIRQGKGKHLTYFCYY